MDVLLFPLIVLTAVFLLVYAVLSLFFAPDRAVARRLEGLTSYESTEVKEAQPLLKSFGERFVIPIGHHVGGIVSAFGPDNYTERLATRIALAGDPRGMTPSILLSWKAGLSVILLVLGLIPGLFGRASFGAAVLLGVAGCVLGFIGPDMWLRNLREHRQAQIRRDLPDMLDMLTISVEAGLGFDAALAKYVKNSHSVLAAEFGKVLKEIQGGMSRRDALRRLGYRTQVGELNSFISSMVQADMLGTSISSVLRTQASEMRLRKRQAVEEQAQKLPVKMVFPVIMCILPATMIVILAPAIIMLMEFFAS